MSVAATTENQIGRSEAAKLNQELMNSERRFSTKKAVWAARIVSLVPILFLLIDGFMKLINAAPVIEAQSQLGIPQNFTLSIGILELACVLLYIVPQSSILGAILLTGYLGGATAIQMRVSNPLFSHLLFPAYVGAFLWAGLSLRDERLRQLIGSPSLR